MSAPVRRPPRRPGRRPSWTAVTALSCAVVLAGPLTCGCGRGRAVPDNVPGRRPATGGPALGQPRITPPQEAVTGARPVAERVRAGLSALPPARRLVVVAVRDVLLRAGAAAHRITLRPRADSAPQGIAFGVYTGRDGAPGACVYGLVTATTVEVEVGGVVEDGGCLLPAPGE